MADHKERVTTTENKEFGIDQITPPDSVDYFIYRTDVAREHKHAKYWMIAFFIAFAVFVATNVYWIWNEMQYEDIEMTQDIDTGEGNAYVAGIGDVNYGESQANNQDSQTQDGR